MQVKLFSLFLILALISLGACSKKSAEKAEKKEAPKKVAGGFVINFKPNDSLDLVPAKTVILQPGGNEGANNFCLDVVAKSIDQVSQVSFDLTFDPALITYQSFKPGTLFEEKGKVDYKIGLKGEDKGKLAGKIGFESGGPAAGSGKAATLCFQGQKPGRIDILFENGEMMDGKKNKISGANWVGGLLWILEAG